MPSSDIPKRADDAAAAQIAEKIFEKRLVIAAETAAEGNGFGEFFFVESKADALEKFAADGILPVRHRKRRFTLRRVFDELRDGQHRAGGVAAGVDQSPRSQFRSASPTKGWGGKSSCRGKKRICFPPESSIFIGTQAFRKGVLEDP